MIILFWFSIFILFFTFIGYPILLTLLPSSEKSLELKVKPSRLYQITVVMVVCNEEKHIVKKLNNLLNLDYPKERLSIVVVDDFSDDGTVDLINKQASQRVTLLKSLERRGKAQGINLAMKNIDTELVFMVDARQSIDLNSANLLARWFDDDKVGAVSGQLQFKQDGSNNFSKGIDGYWRYEKSIRRSESRVGSVVGVSGAIYMLRRKCFKEIRPDTILDDVLIPMNIVKSGFVVGFEEDAIAWDIPSVNVSNEKRRKTRTIRGNYQLLFRFPEWCLPFGHPIWWQFLSHKVLRLLAPAFAISNFIIAILMANGGSEIGIIYILGFMLLVISYPASIYFPVINNVSAIRLASSFVALNWFNLLGFKDFLFTEQNGAWKK